MGSILTACGFVVFSGDASKSIILTTSSLENLDLVFTGDVAMSMQIWRCGFCGANSPKKHTFVKNSASGGFDFYKNSASGGFDFDKNSASCC